MLTIVCVVGLGKIGLPLAAQFASEGMTVIGVDVNPAVIEAVNYRDMPLPFDEPGLALRLSEARAQRRIYATTDTRVAVRESDVIVMLVPVIANSGGEIDFSAMDAATREVAAALRPGTLVIYETTLPVGATRNRYGLMLAEGSGLTMGTDFFLAFSPERVYSGRIFEDLRTYPKIVGGVNEASTERAAAFYRQALETRVWPMRNAEAAEMVKVAETTYRDINIAYANELARYADAYGLDVAEIIAAANSQPYSHIHQPGVGVGGHCIPNYSHFFIRTAPEGGMILARAARQINDGMGAYAVEKLQTVLGGLEQCEVLILGLSYRGEVKEAAFSPAFQLKRALETAGARVYLHDPFFSDEEIRGCGFEPASLTSPPPVDAIILQANHKAYRDLDLSRFTGCRVVLDGRRALNPEGVEGAGMRYLAVGKGD